MRFLVIGQGAREHAMTWKLAQSELVSHLFVAPGNAGTATEPKVSNVAIAATDIHSLLSWAKKNSIDFTIVGPEMPLSMGIVNQFQSAGLACFGPTQAAAQLEVSKVFSKQFMLDNNIPTAKYCRFSQADQAKAYLATCSIPVVIKADGLAAGKGVTVAISRHEALTAIDQLMINKNFGDATNNVIIESFLEGEEISMIVASDGNYYLNLSSSQNYKRRDAKDLGPNTGGMGAYSPAACMTQALEKQINQLIIEPTLAALTKNGRPYTGFLYASIMLTADGPMLLKYNCRLGDPETQVIMMRLESDFAQLIAMACEKKLHLYQPSWRHQYALTTVLASAGYPGSYEKGFPIEGLCDLDSSIKVFHAGTTANEGTIQTNGGRVLSVSALGDQTTKIQKQVNQSAKVIQWPGRFYRNDIGFRAIESTTTPQKEKYTLIN